MVVGVGSIYSSVTLNGGEEEKKACYYSCVLMTVQNKTYITYMREENNMEAWKKTFYANTEMNTYQDNDQNCTAVINTVVL